jgi:sec-independent protein translocase protein TatA
MSVLLEATDRILSQKMDRQSKNGNSAGRYVRCGLCKRAIPSYLEVERYRGSAAGHLTIRWRNEMLNNIGLPGLLLIAVVVLVLFGRGKISSLMGEVGKGITAFKRGVDDSSKELDDSLKDARDVTPEDEEEKEKV